MSKATPVNLALGILDHQLVDSEGRHCGKVDELVVENPEREIDRRRLAHPWPPFVSTINGIAATATRRMMTK